MLILSTFIDNTFYIITKYVLNYMHLSTLKQSKHGVASPIFIVLVYASVCPLVYDLFSTFKSLVSFCALPGRLHNSWACFHKFHLVLTF